MSALSTLPGPLDSFVGREHEIEQIGLLLASARLLTITGPGGVGKTRLAIQAARTLQSAFPGGVHFVDLSPLRAPQTVLPRIAQALGLTGQEPPQILAQIPATLAGRTLLLVDNFEQLLDAAPDLAALLAAAPQLVVLVTSRAPLRIPGEQEFALAPLGLPPAGQPGSAEQILRAPAARLFLLRARQLRPDLELGEDSAAAVAAICRRLDGLPLAIELAAARTRSLPPRQLLERLDRRLELLFRGPGGPGERHSTMRAAIAWSHDLLSPPAQRLFRRLAIFPGGAGLEAIETICAEAAPAEGAAPLIGRLEELIEQSMLQLRESDGQGARYVLLETIGEYAAEQLAASGEGPALQERHAAYYCALVERVAPNLAGSDQRRWLQQLEAEYENLRQAIKWSLAHDGGLIAQQIGGALWRFFWLQGHLRDGRRWLEQALAGDTDAPQPPANEAERAALIRRALAWRSAGNLAWAQIDYAASEAAHRRSLALARAAGDEHAAAAALHGIAAIRAHADDYPAAEQLYSESLAIKRRLGDEYGAALTLNNLGFVAGRRGDLQAARRHYEESAAIKRRLGEHAATAKSLIHLAELSLRLGELEAARRHLAEALGLTEAAAAHVYAAEVVHWSACLAAAARRPAAAARLFGAAERLYAGYGVELHAEDYVLTVVQVRAAREQLGAAAFATAWQAGRELDRAEAQALARELLAQPIDGPASPPPAPEPTTELAEPLSERELEVLQLLATGLSNPAIAERLLISVNTVQTHLRNIYGKLGVSSRSAAISLAYRRGLAGRGPSQAPSP